MKLLSKNKYANGQREVKFLNWVIYKYSSKNFNRVNGTNNIVEAPEYTNFKYTINGSNNKIIINPSLGKDYFINIVINGSNNVIKVNNIIKGALHITIGNGELLPANNCSCIIGKDLSITEATGIILYEHDSSFECGDDVMISHGVNFRGSDGHAILLSDGTVSNRAHSIKIGSHVWICQDVLISKNTEIPDNCIVGTRAVVTKKFTQPNCVIAGVPAKIVKENIRWLHTSPDRVEEVPTENIVTVQPPQMIQKKEKQSVFEKIFSVKNTYENGKKHKCITILGIKLKFKKPGDLVDIGHLEACSGMALHRIKNLNNSAKNFVIGSSYGLYDWLNNSDDLNFSLPSQDLYQSLCCYKKYAKNTIKNVFLFYGVFAYGYNNEFTEKFHAAVAQNYYWKIPYRNKKMVHDKNFKAYEKILKKDKKKFEELANQYDEDYIGLKRTVYPTQEQIKGIAKAHLKNNLRKVSLIDNLKELIKLTEAKNQKLYIIIPPYKECYRRNIPEEKELFKNLYTALEEYKDVKVFNLYSSDMFDEDTDYTDYEHLNKQGAEKLTSFVKEQVLKESKDLTKV